MQTVQDTRRARLGILHKRYQSWAELNVAIGWERTNARLSQVHSGTLRSDRGTPYVMGDETARHVEQALQLPAGWMDTPLTYADIHGTDSPLAKAMLLMENMDPWTLSQALKVLDALAQPAQKTGS
jgi:hypothetical protein